MQKTPNPVDIEIGSRLRSLRVARGLSQETLGEAVGVTFQQIQKYERGTNRISGSRLQQLATVLKVAPSVFFGTPEGAGAEPNPVDAIAGLDAVDLKIARLVHSLQAEARSKVLGIVEAIANATSKAPPRDEEVDKRPPPRTGRGTNGHGIGAHA